MTTDQLRALKVGDVIYTGDRQRVPVTVEAKTDDHITLRYEGGRAFVYDLHNQILMNDLARRFIFDGGETNEPPANEGMTPDLPEEEEQGG